MDDKVKYKIVEKCPVIDRTGQLVASHRVFSQITNQSLVAHCTACQDSGCLLMVSVTEDYYSD